jgi:hypothetical protein
VQLVIGFLNVKNFYLADAQKQTVESANKQVNVMEWCRVFK